MTGNDMDGEREGRRSALVRLVVGGTGALVAALGSLVAAVASPVSRASDSRWRRVIDAADVGDGPVPVVLAERFSDGWYQTRRQSVVFVDRTDDGYRVLSATCSHLGCQVRWSAEASQFRCPCHGGAYDRDGAVVAGPPPRPLTRLTARVNPETSAIEVDL